MTENSNYKKKNTNPTLVVGSEFGKLPPQALELEEAVLGALMIEKDAFSIVSEILRSECFYKDAHQKIYDAIVGLATSQQPVDMYTVTEQLRKNGTIDNIGGPYYISLLTAKVSSAVHLEYHARIVSQKHMARELIRISSEIQTKAFDEKNDIDDLMQESEGMLFELTQHNLKKDALQISPIIEAAILRMNVAANQDGASGVPSGFHALDKITAGWQSPDLVIIAARPAMGKTAFVLSMAKNMAVDFQVPVAVFSLEMSNLQLVNRLIMNVCEIEGEKIKNGKLSPAEWEMLDRKIKKLHDAPLFVDDTPGLSIFELRSKARRLVRESKVGCIIIDYLQLMNASGMKFGSREQEVSIISRSLKELAKELDIPIIALSQLNRGVTARAGNEGRVPQLSDLRESGAIEQDADMVCFIHRPEYYGITDIDGQSTAGLAEIIIAKHRNGATGTVNLRFKAQFTRFANLDDLDDDLENQNSLYQTFTSKMNNEASEKGFYGDTAPTPPPSSSPPTVGLEGLEAPEGMPF